MGKKKGRFSHPKWKHFLIVAKFFIFKFALGTMDMVTDVMTARDFFHNGHTNWGVCTMLPVFAPFTTKAILVGIRLVQCYKIRVAFPMSFTITKDESALKIQLQQMPKLIMDFPFIQPFR